MITYGELNIKNRLRFVFNSMTNVKGLDISLVSVNQISFTNDNVVSYVLNIMTIMSILIACILFLMM